MDNNQYEKLLIGTIISDPPSIAEALDITQQDFSIPQHRLIWNKVYELASRGTLSHRSLTEALHDNLNTFGSAEHKGEDYLSELEQLADLPGLVEYAIQVKEASAKHRMIEMGADLISQSRNGHSSDEILQEHIKQLLLLQAKQSKDIRPIGSYFGEVNNKLEQSLSNNQVQGWMVPLTAMNRTVYTLQDTDFALVVGETGTGKTHFARYNAFETALRGQVAGILSFENTPQETVSWGWAYLSGVNHSRLLYPQKLTRSDKEKLEETKDKLKSLPLYIEELGIANSQKTVDMCRRFKLQHPEATLIVIDGIYLVQGKNDTFETISNFTQTLRSLAQEIHTPLICTTQFRKKNKGESDDKKRGLNDIFYAGEKAARTVWSLSKVKMTGGMSARFPNNLFNSRLLPEDNLNTIVITVDTLKNTNGPTGNSDQVAWDKTCNHFLSLELEWNKTVVTQEMIEQNEKVMSTYPSFTSAPKPVKAKK